MSDKSLALVRAARAMAVSKGTVSAAKIFLAAAFGPHNEGGEWLARQVMDTTSLEAGSAALRDLGAFLIGQVSRRSVIGRIGQAVPFYRVPMTAPVLTETAGASGYWTQQATPIKTSGLKFTTFELDPLKCTALVPYSIEFLRATDPNVDTAIQRDLANALARTEDAAFCDPTNAGVPDEMPASPFYGNVTAGTGNPAAALDTLLNGYPDDLLRDAVLLINPADVPKWIAAGYASNDTLTVNDGGTLAGLMTATASAIPRGAVGVVCPGAIALADGGAMVEASTQALVEVEDADTGTTELVSLWQTNCVALRAIHYTNWRVGRDGSARMVTGALA